MKVRLPEVQHPTRWVLGAVFVLGCTALSIKEQVDEQQDQLTAAISAQGQAALGGQAIKLDGFTTTTIDRPPKPFSKKKPRPTLGATDVMEARNTVMRAEDQPANNADALALSSCVLAAVNAPSFEDVSPTLKLAKGHFDEGQHELAAANCTDYLATLAPKLEHIVTITGLANTSR